MKNQLIKEMDKKIIKKINELRDWAFLTDNYAERARRLAKVDGYHEAYQDIIFALGLEKEVFKTSVV
jgi:hypothetical protein